jgi:hypothetical protein
MTSVLENSFGCFVFDFQPLRVVLEYQVVEYLRRCINSENSKWRSKGINVMKKINLMKRSTSFTTSLVPVMTPR